MKIIGKITNTSRLKTNQCFAITDFWYIFNSNFLYFFKQQMIFHFKDDEFFCKRKQNF